MQNNYNSAILTDSQNQKVDQIISDLKKLNLYKSLNDIETFTSGGGYVHTLILCKNGHIVAIHFEDNLIEYSARTYLTLESYLSEEMLDIDLGFGYEYMQDDYEMRSADLDSNLLIFFKDVAAKKMARGGSLDSLQIKQIASLSGIRENAIIDWSSENGLNSNDLSNIMMGLGRKQISAADFSTAVIGNKGNKFSKEIIAYAKENKGYKMADGGNVAEEGIIGQEIVFDDNGEVNTGVIKDIHENTGNYIVKSDDGRTLLADKELDVISLGKMRKAPEKKKIFGLFAQGGKLSNVQRQKFARVMHEWKEGKLHSGSSDGPIVTDKDQAIAIAYSEANSLKKMAEGGNLKKSTFIDQVTSFLIENGYDVSQVDEISDGTITIYQSTEKVGANRKDFFDGMQIIRHPNNTFEVSEYMAGPNEDELYIYKETNSLKVALKDLLKGNNRKPIRKYGLGGALQEETNIMFNSEVKEAKHHIAELEKVKKGKQIEPWVLAKLTRAKTDLSDLTHYLDGKEA